VRIESISRADSPSLLGAMLGASSQAAGQRALVDGLDKLQVIVGNPESDTSPAALLAQLRETVQSHAAAPDNVLMARAMLDAAGNVASALRTASSTVQQVRVEADVDHGDVSLGREGMPRRPREGGARAEEGRRRGAGR